MAKQAFHNKILLGALPAAALASTLSASPANAQATVCIGNVCESSNSGSVSVGPTTVYNNGNGTYVNGRRVDPRNPRPLTNPNWQEPVARPQAQLPARPQYQYTPPSYAYTPQYSAPSTPVTCPINIDLSATFDEKSYDVNFTNFTFSSVEAFQNAKAKMAKYGYLDSKYVSSPTCGPIAVAAMSRFLENNPDRMRITKTNTGSRPPKGSDFSLELSF